MLCPCEVAVKCVLPVLRAMMAKDLMVRHQKKQVDVANLLGISQSAVSLYGKNIRGRAINLENDEEVSTLINNISNNLANNKMTHLEFMTGMCRVCKIIRRKELMCNLHKTFDQKIDIERCDFCFL